MGVPLMVYDRDLDLTSLLAVTSTSVMEMTHAGTCLSSAGVSKALWRNLGEDENDLSLMLGGELLTPLAD